MNPWEKRQRTRAARQNSKKRTRTRRGPDAGVAVSPWAPLPRGRAGLVWGNPELLCTGARARRCRAWTVQGMRGTAGLIEGPMEHPRHPTACHDTLREVHSVPAALARRERNGGDRGGGGHELPLTNPRRHSPFIASLMFSKSLNVRLLVARVGWCACGGGPTRARFNRRIRSPQFWRAGTGPAKAQHQAKGLGWVFEQHSSPAHHGCDRRRLRGGSSGTYTRYAAKRGGQVISAPPT
eukprot:gene24136-biopygen5889